MTMLDLLGKTTIAIPSMALMTGTLVQVSPAAANPVQKPSTSPAIVRLTPASSLLTISQRDAENGSAPSIVVGASGGTNLSFLSTGEIIQKAWLDPVNPVRVTLDVDGQFCSEAARSCQGATVIHLKQITPLPFPNLPKANSTLLTVIAAVPGGSRRLYTFRIQYGGNDANHTVAVMPDRPGIATVTGVTPAIDPDRIAQGLQVAQQKQWVYPGTPLCSRIERFIALVRAGRPAATAAGQAGISMQLVTRLMQLGSGDLVLSPT